MYKSKRSFAFGSSQKRFGKITAHPHLDPSGLFAVRPIACDPCLYHPRDVRDIYPIKLKRQNEKDPWRYKIELEEWSKNLGYRNQNILKCRRWNDSILGPAWYEIKESAPSDTACRNVGFGRTARFKDMNVDISGPVTYFRDIPYKAFHGPHSDRPSFLRDERCRFKDSSPKWSLACNRYKIIDKDCIEEKPRKIVSKRGPYDLFTGKRDGSTIKNYFSTSLKVSAATWPYKLGGSFDTYKNSRFGVMNKTSRSIPFRGRLAATDLALCLKNPKDPGPASYDIKEKKEFKQYKFGFNSSYDRPPGYTRVVVWPGVGRYMVKEPDCGPTGHGHRHVFLSKQERTIGAIIPEPMYSF